MNYITDQSGKPHSRFYPQPVRDVGQASVVTPVTSEAITFAAGAAGLRGILNLAKSRVGDVGGALVGSHWREIQNLCLQSDSLKRRIIGIVETATSATVTITDTELNLELLLEMTTGNSRFVIKLTDPTGNELYGYIRGIAASGNAYTITVNNTLAGGTQSWVGNTTNFVSTNVEGCSFEIYAYSSSLSFGTGTILLQEKLYDPRMSDFEVLLSLTTDGDYAVDYMRGRIFYRKATTGTSDTVNYTSVASASSGGGVSATDNSAFTVGSSTTTPIAAIVDEVSPGSVTEGNSGVVRMTATREIRTAETYAPTYEDNVVGVAKVEQRFSYSYISSATTTTIKSGAGFLHTITITEAVASTIIVYDNTAGSGTIIASFVASAGVGTYHLNVAFGTGLTIVTAGASKLTTSYR